MEMLAINAAIYWAAGLLRKRAVCFMRPMNIPTEKLEGRLDIVLKWISV
jgi:hypothetical protein